jgi:hypothetical protein
MLEHAEIANLIYSNIILQILAMHHVALHLPSSYKSQLHRDLLSRLQDPIPLSDNIPL